MKFGLLMHKNCMNIGDDIQSLAISKLLPQIDYFVDREDLPNFKPDNEEPVAVLMCAWYMWKKWNWPPNKYIVPKLMSMHYADHVIAKQPGSPANYEFWTGIGADYLKAYGPVGCRDMFTLGRLKEIGVDAYFSGCITLTLPKMPERKPEKEYICAVDIVPSAVKKLREILKDTDIEVKVITHNKDKRDPDAGWEKTKERVTELLTTYQNAKCVVTRRLHCALPCLAMEVPVFVLNKGTEASKIRFEPYDTWFEHCSSEEFVAGEFDYDFKNPPKNSTKYVETRENLIRMAKEFVEEYKDKTGTPDDYVKTTYTQDEVMKWQNTEMRNTLDKWLLKERENTHTIIGLNKNVNKLNKEIDKLKAERTKLKDEKSHLNDEIKNQKAEKAQLTVKLKKVEKENERYLRILNCKSVKSAVKVRNAFCSKDKKIKY